MARLVIWGSQPTVCNLKPSHRNDPEFSEIYNFIVKTAKFYYSNREFLFDGEMLSPRGFECGEKEVVFSTRMIFTKENTARVIRKKMPCVLHSCWKSPEGEKALFLANYTSNPQDWSYQGHSGTIKPHSYSKINLS
jgi:hypothetical protein